MPQDDTELAAHFDRAATWLDEIGREIRRRPMIPSLEKAEALINRARRDLRDARDFAL